MSLYKHDILTHIMDTILNNEKIRWVNITNPTREDLRYVLPRMHLPLGITGDLLSPTDEAIAKRHANGVWYFTIHIPTDIPGAMDEHDIVVNDTSLLTINYQDSSALNFIIKQFETFSLTHPSPPTTGSIDPLFLVLHIIGELFLETQGRIIRLREKLEMIIHSERGSGEVKEIQKIIETLFFFKESWTLNGILISGLKEYSHERNKSLSLKKINQLTNYHKTILKNVEDLYSFSLTLRDTVLQKKDTTGRNILTLIEYGALSTVFLAAMAGILGFTINTTETIATGLFLFSLLGVIVGFILLRKKKII